MVRRKQHLQTPISFGSNSYLWGIQTKAAVLAPNGLFNVCLSVKFGNQSTFDPVWRPRGHHNCSLRTGRMKSNILVSMRIFNICDNHPSMEL